MDDEDVAFVIRFPDRGNHEIVAHVSGWVTGLEESAIVLNYIPDLLRRKPNNPAWGDGIWNLSLTVSKAENGAFVVSDYDSNTDNVKRYICPDNAALYTEMRAWTERQIEQHQRSAASRERTESLSAARDLSV